MNRVMTAALAGLIATTTVATSVATASAGGGYWQGGGYGQNGNWQGGGYGQSGNWQGGYGQGPYWKHGPGYGQKPWNNYPPRYHGNGNGNGNWGAAVAGGAILGLALGAVIASQPPPPPRYYAPPPPQPYYPAQPVYAQPVYPTLNQAHVDWCAATYPNYQPATDTYLASNGVYYRCVGPY